MAERVEAIGFDPMILWVRILPSEFMKIMNWFVKKLFANKLFTELLSQYIWLNFEQSNAKKLREFYGLEEVHFKKDGNYYWKREKQSLTS